MKRTRFQRLFVSLYVFTISRRVTTTFVAPAWLATVLEPYIYHLFLYCIIIYALRVWSICRLPRARTRAYDKRTGPGYTKETCGSTNNCGSIVFRFRRPLCDSRIQNGRRRLNSPQELVRKTIYHINNYTGDVFY